MKRYLQFCFIILTCYLVSSLIVAVYSELEFRWGLTHHLLLMGKKGFLKTEQLLSDINGDQKLHHFQMILELTPPFGWTVLRRERHLVDVVVFASMNEAIPEAQRFSDRAQSKKFGFDPDKKRDDQITGEMFFQLR